MGNNKTKILYILPRFHPFKGGAEQNILAMAERMVVAGYDVTVYTTDVKFRNEKLPKFEKYNGIKIHRHWAINESLYAGFYPQLLPKLLKNQFDVIHVSGFGFAWVEFCLVIKKLICKIGRWKYPTKFVNTPHGPFMATTTEGMKFKIKQIYTIYLRIIIPYLYDAVIAVVDNQYKWMAKEYFIKKEKIHVVPNGIDADYIEKKIAEFSAEDKVIITYLNRMEWYKGIQDVLFAIKNILETRNDLKDKFEFWIMGRPGGYTPKLKEIIEENNLQENTKLIFSPSDEQRDEAYLQSQINILPSKWEATGIVLIEAMAKGNAIISTNQNDAVDMLINEYSGYSYDFGDVEKLTGILIELITEYEKRQQIRLHNHQASRNFTWDAVFPKYESLIKDLTTNE